MQTQVIFFVGIHRRNVNASAVCARADFLCIRKDFVKQQKRSFMREVVERRKEFIVNRGALGFEQFLDTLGHFANHGFNHPFAPLLDAHCKFCRRNFSQ